MITQWPLEAAPASEALPDPGALKKLQRETRRLVTMSQGAVMFAVGITCLVLAAGFLQPWLPATDANLIYFMPSILLLVLVGAVTNAWIMRARKRAGVPQVTLPQRQTPSTRRVLWIVLSISIAFAFSVMLISFWLPEQLNRISLLGLMIMTSVPMVLRGIRLGLWEPILQAAGIPMGFALLAMGALPRQLGWLCLVFAVTHLITGYSLHQRWKAWVASLPAAESGLETLAAKANNAGREI